MATKEEIQKTLASDQKSLYLQIQRVAESKMLLSAVRKTRDISSELIMDAAGNYRKEEAALANQITQCVDHLIQFTLEASADEVAAANGKVEEDKQPT